MKAPQLLVIVPLALPSVSVAQVPFTNLVFDFLEPAFTTGPVSGTQGYNIINDSTGAKLGADNGDRDDLFIAISSSLPANATGSFADVDLRTSGGLRSNHGYRNSAAATYDVGASNNPGSLVSSTIRITFGNHVTLSNFETDFVSLNTRGATWEYAKLAYLKPDGSYFSSEPTIGNHASWSAATNPLPAWNIGTETAGNGASGSPSIGWFVTAANDTVSNVGSNATTSGGNGSKEALTSTNSNSFLDYNDVNLPAGTAIGGFEWTMYVEDTRGTSNGPSSWTATQDFFRITGTVPEPSTGLFSLIGLAALALRRR